MAPREVPRDASGSAPKDVSPRAHSNNQLQSARMATAPCLSSASVYHSLPSSINDHGQGTGGPALVVSPLLSLAARYARRPSHAAELSAALGTRWQWQGPRLSPRYPAIASQRAHPRV
eukprot:scaffold181821_cov29-Tisochrysis_lutea.AAC.5